MDINFFMKILSHLSDNKLFSVLFAVIIFIAAMKCLHIFENKFSRNLINTTNDPERIKEIKTIYHVAKSTIDIALWLTFIMTILTKLGVDIRPILAAAGVLGVAVGFGAKRFVEDVITGIIILIEGQVRVGDVVELAGKSGTVEKVDLKMVVLRDLSGCVHYIRNGMIDVVSNMTRDYSYYLLDLVINYNEDVDRVQKILKEIFDTQLINNEEFSSSILDPIEILGLNNFGDTGLIIKLRIKTKPTDQWKIGREFNKLLLNKFRQEGIEIPYNQNKYLFEIHNQA